MTSQARPILSAIAAMSDNRVIGFRNQLPWHLPADLKHFKTLTSGHPILMGRKTFESIGKPLPNRTNIILTRDASFKAQGCTIATSLTEATAFAAQLGAPEIFIIGGADIYRQLLPSLERLYLTIIHHEFEGDTFFPALAPDEWLERKQETHARDEANPYSYRFLLLERRKPR